jgi:Carboxypeptidase regulatory-like domain
MNCRPFRVFFVLLILLGSGFRVQSQSSQGRFSGTVTDTSGAAVLNATINIENLGTHVSRTLQTNSSGDDVAPSIDPGFYSITVEAKGFTKVVLERVRWKSATT